MNKGLTLKLFKIITVTSLVGMLAGCASRPQSYNAVASHMPQLKAGYARVFFYCDQAANLTRQQDIICYLDDAVVGHLSTQQFTYADHRAGRVEVRAKTTANSLMAPRQFALDLEPGDVRYVHLAMKFTLPADVRLGIVEAEKGEEDVKTCIYTGAPLPAQSTKGNGAATTPSDMVVVP